MDFKALATARADLILYLHEARLHVQDLAASDETGNTPHLSYLEQARLLVQNAASRKNKAKVDLGSWLRKPGCRGAAAICWCWWHRQRLHGWSIAKIRNGFKSSHSLSPNLVSTCSFHGTWQVWRPGLLRARADMYGVHVQYHHHSSKMQYIVVPSGGVGFSIVLWDFMGRGRLRRMSSSRRLCCIFSYAFGNSRANYLAAACAQVSWEILPSLARAAVEMSLSCACCSAVSSLVPRVHVACSVHQRACRCSENVWLWGLRAAPKW